MPKHLPRANPRLSDINELRQFLHKQKKEKVLKARQCNIQRVKRSFLDRHRLLVVKLRYGPDFKIIRTWKEITELTGIASTTLIEMIRQYHENGNSEKRRYSPGRPPWPIPAVVAYIKKNLEQNAFQSSRYWCAQIQNRFNFPLTQPRLLIV